MRLKFRNNSFGYFRFYYSVLGYTMFVYLGWSILISLLDGMGLAMFMPLLQTVAGDASGKESLGFIRYITDAVESVGLELNLTTILTILVLLFILKGFLKFVQLNYQVKIRDLFIRRVRHGMIKNLQELNYSGFLKLDAGRIQNTLTGEVQRLFLSMNHYFNAAQAGAMLLTYIVLAFLANYQFAFLVALGSGLSSFLYKKIYTATKTASMALSEKGNDFNSFLVQAIYYFKYLKSTNYFSRYASKLKEVIDETEYLNKRIGSYLAITVSAKEPIIILIVSLVILLQVNLMHASLSSIILSLLLFYRALTFLMLVQSSWQNFTQNIGGINAVVAISDEMLAMKEVQGKYLFKEIHKELTICDVEFSYGPNKILNRVNIRIPKNQTVALVGESGSGKTTIANMIAGLIKPDSGDVLVDDVPLQQYNLDSFRNIIGYISQEPVIFNDNIYNNVTFWAELTPENKQRFDRIIQLTSLSEFVNAQPDKELTRLGDNGILISGGQKQRISIARELYKNAGILIFDEATSALDSETERIIQGNIEQLHGNYTIVIIAHRLSTIKEADIIYLLEKGKVTASGSFNKMVENSPKFERMVALQKF